MFRIQRAALMGWLRSSVKWTSICILYSFLVLKFICLVTSWRREYIATYTWQFSIHILFLLFAILSTAHWFKEKVSVGFSFSAVFAWFWNFSSFNILIYWCITLRIWTLMLNIGHGLSDVPFLHILKLNRVKCYLSFFSLINCDFLLFDVTHCARSPRMLLLQFIIHEIINPNKYKIYKFDIHCWIHERAEWFWWKLLLRFLMFWTFFTLNFVAKDLHFFFESL